MERVPLASLINKESIKSKYHPYQPLLKQFQDVMGHVVSHFDEPFDFKVELGSIKDLLDGVSFHLKRSGDYVESSFDDQAPPKLLVSKEIVAAAATKILVNEKPLANAMSMVVLFSEEDGGTYKVKEIDVEQPNGKLTSLPGILDRSLQISVEWIVVCSPYYSPGFKFTNCVVNIADGLIESVAISGEPLLHLYHGGTQPGPVHLVFPPPSKLPTTDFHVNFHQGFTTQPFEYDEDVKIDVECEEIPVQAFMLSTDTYFVSMHREEPPGTNLGHEAIESVLMDIHKPPMDKVESFERFWERVLHESIKFNATKISYLALIPVLRFRDPFTFDVVFEASAIIEHENKKYKVNKIGSKNIEIFIAPVEEDTSPLSYPEKYDKIQIEPIYTDYFTNVHYFAPSGFTFITQADERVSLHDKASFRSPFLNALHVFLNPSTRGYSILNPLTALYSSILAEVDASRTSVFSSLMATSKGINDPLLKISIPSSKLIPIYIRQTATVFEMEKLIPLGYASAPLPYSTLEITFHSIVPDIIEYASASKHVYCYSFDAIEYSPCFESDAPLRLNKDPLDMIKQIESLAPLPASIIIKNRQFVLQRSENLIATALPPSVLTWLDARKIDGKLVYESGKLNLAGLIEILGVNCFDYNLLLKIFNKIFDDLLDMFRPRLEKLLGGDFSNFLDTHKRLRETFNLGLLDFISGFLHMVPFKNIDVNESILPNGLRIPLLETPLELVEPVKHVALRDVHWNTTTESIQHCILVFGHEAMQSSFLYLDILAPIVNLPPCCPDKAISKGDIIEITITTNDLQGLEPSFDVHVKFVDDHGITFLRKHYVIDGHDEIAYAKDEVLLDIITLDSPSSEEFPLATNWHSTKMLDILDIKRIDGRLFNKEDVEHIEKFFTILDRKPIKLENKETLLGEFKRSIDDISVVHFSFKQPAQKEIIVSLLRYTWKGIEEREPEQITPEKVEMPGEDWTIHKTITIKTASNHFYPIKIEDHLHFSRRSIDFLKDDDHVAAIAAAPDLLSMILQVKRQQSGKIDESGLNAIREREGKLAEMKQMKERIGANQKDSIIYKRLEENIAKSTALIEEMRNSVEKAAGISVLNFKFSVNDSIQFINANGETLSESIIAILPDFVPVQTSWTVTGFSDRIDEKVAISFTQSSMSQLAKPTRSRKPSPAGASATPATPTKPVKPALHAKPVVTGPTGTTQPAKKSKKTGTLESITPNLNLEIGIKKKPNTTDSYIARLAATKPDGSIFSTTKNKLASNRDRISQKGLMDDFYEKFLEQAKKLNGWKESSKRYMGSGKEFLIQIEFDAKEIARITPGIDFKKSIPEITNELLRIFTVNFATFAKDFDLLQDYEQKPQLQAKPVKAVPAKPIKIPSAPKPIAPSKPLAAPKPVKPRAAPKPVKPLAAPKPVKPRAAPKPVKPRAAPKPVKPRAAPKPVKPLAAPKPVKPRAASKPVKPRAASKPVKSRPSSPDDTEGEQRLPKPATSLGSTSFKLAAKKPWKKLEVSVEKYPTSYTVTFAKYDKSIISKTKSPKVNESQYGLIVRIMTLLYRDAITGTDYEEGGKRVVFWLDGRQIKDDVNALKITVESKANSIQEDFNQAEMG